MGEKGRKYIEGKDKGGGAITLLPEGERRRGGSVYWCERVVVVGHARRGGRWVGGRGGDEGREDG